MWLTISSFHAESGTSIPHPIPSLETGFKVDLIPSVEGKLVSPFEVELVAAFKAEPVPELKKIYHR